MSELQHTIQQQRATLTDEKLEEYLRIWNRLIEQGYRKMLDIDLVFNCDVYIGEWYTLTFGEERRELTCAQFWHVKEWLDSLARFT